MDRRGEDDDSALRVETTESPFGLITITTSTLPKRKRKHRKVKYTVGEPIFLGPSRRLIREVAKAIKDARG